MEEEKINVEEMALSFEKDEPKDFSIATLADIIDPKLPLSPLGELRAYQQYSGDVCGFHSVFNCINFLQSLKIEGDDFKSTKIDPSSFNRGQKFWKYYHEMCDFLMKNYPNKNEVENIDKYAALDRGHFEFLLEEFPDFKEAKKFYAKEFNINLHFSKFYFGMGVIQNSIVDIYDFDDLVNQIADGKRHIITFFLGVTTHWSLLFVFAEKGKVVASVYLDSRNDKLSDILQKNYDSIIASVETRRKLIGKTNPLSERELKLEKHWINDLSAALEIILVSLQGGKTIFAFLLESQIRELENDIMKHTQLSLGDNNYDSLADKSKFAADLYRWYDEEYRPQVITNDIINPIFEKPGDLTIEAKKKLEILSEVSLRTFGKIENPKELGFEPKLIQDIIDMANRISSFFRSN